MKYPFYFLTQEMIEKLHELGAKAWVASRNYDPPHHNLSSSIHFFSSMEKDENGDRDEVAYYIPEMHNPGKDKLSGFSVVSRKNGIDGQCSIVNKIDWSEMKY